MAKVRPGLDIPQSGPIQPTNTPTSMAYRPFADPLETGRAQGLKGELIGFFLHTIRARGGLGFSLKGGGLNIFT